MKFRCIRKCFFGQLWEPGQIMEADHAPHHFEAVGGETVRPELAAEGPVAINEPVSDQRRGGRRKAKVSLADYAPPNAKADPVSLGDLGL